jgi:hypothetical protein
MVNLTVESPIWQCPSIIYFEGEGEERLVFRRLLGYVTFPSDKEYFPVICLFATVSLKENTLRCKP